MGYRNRMELVRNIIVIEDRLLFRNRIHRNREYRE